VPLAAPDLEVGVLMRFLRVPRRTSDTAVRDKLRGQTKCDETVLSPACNVGPDRFAQLLAVRPS
jgi:hypothetical protein